MGNTITLGNRTTGVLRNDGVYISHRTPRHFFIKFNGFGLSCSILDELRHKKATKIIILYDNGTTQKKHIATISDFYEHGINYTDKEADRQKILPLKYFKDE